MTPEDLAGALDSLGLQLAAPGPVSMHAAPPPQRRSISGGDTSCGAAEEMQREMQLRSEEIQRLGGGGGGAFDLWHSVLAGISTLYSALQLDGDGDATECIAQKQQAISDFHLQLSPMLNSLGEAGTIVSKYVRRGHHASLTTKWQRPANKLTRRAPCCARASPCSCSTRGWSSARR